MAQRIQILLTDDLDPELEATETIVFGLDGASYEIDLNSDHALQMREAIEPYVTAARKSGGRQAVRRVAKPMSAPEGIGPDAHAVRTWAREQGISVNERGRIKGSVVARFLEASS